MKKLSFFIGCFLFLGYLGFAQEDIISDTLIITDSITAEPPNAKKEKNRPIRNFFKKNYPDPKKAMILSFVLPGSGQLYNKKYWKLPLVYGAYGLMIYFIDFSSGQYKFFKQEYIYCVDDDPETISLLKTQKGWGEDDIKSERDLYRKRVELSYVGLFAVSLLSGVDAFVDAHLKGFDVSDDLTMKVKPKIDYSPFEGSNLGIGVGLSLHLNKKPNPQPKVFFGNP